LQFVHVRLGGPPSLQSFYRDVVPVAELEFGEMEGAPFYHFALLVPGDRFDAADTWASRELDVVGDVFEFADWKARARYFHDPAGNIVELIAHAGVGEGGRIGAFSPDELLGVSELGLVGDVAPLVDGLAAIGLHRWDGEELAFVGERACTLIAAAAGRGWLPTGRPAEPHPVEVVIDGATGDAVLDGRYAVRCAAT
jgi:hypothetical protein